MLDIVGGYRLNEALHRLNPHGRVALCGAIRSYNMDMKQPEPLGGTPAISSLAPYMKHGMALISLPAKIQGFIVLDYVPQWTKAKQQ